MANKFVWSGATRTTNGGFDSDTGWTKGTGWAISGGVATKTAGSASDLEQNQTVTDTVTYQTVFTVSGRTAGTIFIRLGGTSGTSRSTNATFTENIVCGAGADPKLELVADDTFDGSVDNVGVYANTGASWDDAYTSLMRDWGAEGTFTPATDYIYVRSVHSETSGTTLTITGSTAEGTTAACRVICVVGDTTGTTPGNLATGASVTTNNTSADIIIDKSIYLYGVNFYSNDDISVGTLPADQNIVLETCRLELIGTATGDRIYIGLGWTSNGPRITLIDTDFDFASASQGIALQNAIFSCIGGSVDYDVNGLVIGIPQGPVTQGSFIGVDFSVLTSSYLVTGAVGADALALLKFSRCLLASGATIVNGTIDVPGFRVESYHCQIGTDADPSYQMEIRDSRGKVSANTAKYRTGGASDGVRSTPISWDFDTTVGSVRGYPGHAFEGPPISAWTTGDGATQHTYRIAFASDASIKDDELWMELEGPNDAATNSLAALKTTRVAPQGTAAAYTTDSGSTWTGTGVGTMQYMQVQYTPDKPGPVTVRVYMAKASDNIYVDPKIQIDPS